MRDQALKVGALVLGLACIAGCERTSRDTRPAAFKSPDSSRSLRWTYAEAEGPGRGPTLSVARTDQFGPFPPELILECRPGGQFLIVHADDLGIATDVGGIERPNLMGMLAGRVSVAAVPEWENGAFDAWPHVRLHPTRRQLRALFAEDVVTFGYLSEDGSLKPGYARFAARYPAPPESFVRAFVAGCA
jgi:hypothetical protein